MEISKATNISDATQIAKLHIMSFPGFFLSFLGEGFLRYLYKGFILHQDSGVLIAKENGSILGFLAYSTKLSEFYSFLIKKYFFVFAWYGLLGAIRNPKSLFRIIRALTYPTNTKSNEEYIEISSIAVDPTIQTKGIGSQLISFLVKLFHDTKYSTIRLETDAENNEKVNRFYQANGFEIINETVTPEGRKMNHYKINLDPQDPNK